MNELEEFIKSRITLYNHYKETFITEDAKEMAERISKRYQYELKKMKKDQEEKETQSEPVGIFEFFE